MTELVRIRVRCPSVLVVVPHALCRGAAGGKCSEYSSDQDDSCASDQDDLLYQRDFKGSTICPYPCPYTKGRQHAELPCRCREIAESR